MAKIAKISGDDKWEVLTFAKSSGHSTRCFEGQVKCTVPVQHGTPGNMGEIPGNGQGSLHIQIRTLYAKDIFTEHNNADISKI